MWPFNHVHGEYITREEHIETLELILDQAKQITELSKSLATVQDHVLEKLKRDVDALNQPERGGEK